MKTNPTPDVSSKYGAPMGRRTHESTLPDEAPREITLRHIPLDKGGYDDGGAYWGIAEPLYWAGDDSGLDWFFRADDTDAAKAIVMAKCPHAVLATEALHVDYELALSQLPAQCIAECSGSGDATAAVARWRNVLNLTVNRERAIACLTGYGSWSRAELAKESNETIAERVLWLACGDFAAYICDCEDAGIDPRDERPETFETNTGSDFFCLE